MDEEDELEDPAPFFELEVLLLLGLAPDPDLDPSPELDPEFDAAAVFLQETELAEEETTTAADEVEFPLPTPRTSFQASAAA